ncbi:DoxX family protein [Pedobacter sp. AW1-32]|uniref:DoxX family protein n=1 Tax=Pedobacter sp. AW1-32 TaxID=3383026 RepID=UPI003FEDFE5D
MKLLKNIQNWGDRHHPKWLDYFRILLGIILIWKGIAFATNLQAFDDLMRGAMIGTAVSISLIAHLIIIMHLIGGAALILGTNTRFFCLVNLPILIGAVFFVNLSPNIFRPYSELWLSIVVLAGLLCFFVEGNGIISVERRNSNVLT